MPIKSFFLPLFFLFLFLFFKFILFKDLPETSILWLVIECSASDFLKVASTSHRSFMMLSKLSIKDNFSNFNISQCFMTSAEHKVATS